jgi:hypothetical protein
MHHEDRTLGVAHKEGADAPEDHALKEPRASSGYDQYVGVLVLGGFYEHLPRVSDREDGFDVKPVPGHPVSRFLEAVAPGGAPVLSNAD